MSAAPLHAGGSRRPALLAGIVAGSMFMEMLDSTVILTAFPRMAESFHTSPVSLSIGVTAYLLALAALLPASGWIADRFGTRRVFALAVVGFIAASVLCGLSNSLEQFAAARVLQGAAAAVMSPVARLAMLKTIDLKQIAAAMNKGAAAALLGPTIGPPLGGFITTYLNWRGIFFLNLPVGLVGLYAAWRWLPNLRAAQVRRFDLAGCLLNAAAMIGVLYGLHLLGEGGGEWRVGSALILAGVVAGVFAVRHALRTEEPLMSVVVMRVRSFRAGVLGGGLYRMGIFAPVFVLPLLLQIGLGMSAFVSGLFILLNGAADVAAKLFTLRVLRGIGFRRMLIGSASLYALFPLGLMAVNTATPGILLALLLVFGGIARSLHMSASNTMVYADLPAAHLSGASTLAAVSQQLAQALAVAIAALLVNVSVQWLASPGSALQLRDFQPALGLAAVAALTTNFWYLKLPHDTGAALSGHRPGIDSD
jgi:EmrB/QacA subfamily drug resistance transporter